MQVQIAEALTKERFAPYGEVIEIDGRDFFHINQGQTERYHGLAQVEVREQDYPLISFFRSKPTALPVRIDMLERHPLGSQALIPLNGERLLIVVAEPGDIIRPETMRAFVTNGRQGVNYGIGVWHFPVLTLDKLTDILVVDRGGGDNCEERLLSEPFHLDIPLSPDERIPQSPSNKNVSYLAY